MSKTTNKVHSLLSTARSTASELQEIGSVSLDDVIYRCSQLADELEMADFDVDTEYEPGERCPLCEQFIMDPDVGGELDVVAVFVARLLDYVSPRLMEQSLRETVDQVTSGEDIDEESWAKATELANTLGALRSKAAA